MSALHLLWIIPLTASVSAFVTLIAITAMLIEREGKKDED